MVIEAESQAEFKYMASVIILKTIIYKNIVLGHNWERAKDIFMEMVMDEVETMVGRNGENKMMNNKQYKRTK